MKEVKLIKDNTPLKEILKMGTSFHYPEEGNEQNAVLRFIPFWFKEESDGTYIMYSFNSMPKELVDLISDMREPTDSEFYDVESYRQVPLTYKDCIKK